MNIIKVLEVNSVCGAGSTGRIVVDLYRELEKVGHTCVIAYGRGNAPSDIKTIKIGCNLDNYVHGLKTRLFDKQCFSSTRATRNLIEKVKEYNPDIIHLHNLHGYYINIEVLFEYLKKSNKRVIWTLHDCWPFTGHCSYFEYVGCKKWKCECKDCIQKKEYPSSRFIDNSRWNYEQKKRLFTSLKKDNMQIITPSNWLAGLVKRSFLSKYNVDVINNGVDTSSFKPTESGFRKKYNLENNFIILGVANIWDRRKGIKYYCELAKRLDDKYKIVLVGIDRKLKRKIPNNILSIERTENKKELAEVYTAADVFVNLSLEDNYPTTNLEAIACGTPVFTFDSGGSAECINKYNLGLSIKCKDLDMVVEKIAHFDKKRYKVDFDIKSIDKYTSCKRYEDIMNILLKE